MALRLISVFTLAVLTCLCGCDGHAEDREDIQRLWVDLETCNNERNGAAVLSLFSDASFKRYDWLLKVGLDGTPKQVRALGLSDMMEVLLMRSRATRSELAGLDGRQYTQFATSRGWYVDLDESESRLRRFRFGGDDATAEVVLDGEATGVRVRFVRQHDAWRLDEPSSLDEWDRFLLDYAAEWGLSKEELALEFVQEEVGHQLPDSVWDPMPR